MAVLAAFANGNLTSSSTWETVDSTSYSNSESANTALTTSYVESSTFTPGAITIDGIAVKIASRAASPTGTMSIRLAQGGVLVTNTEITVNVSDLPTCTATSGSTTPVSTAEGGWFFVKFGSSVTLAGATAYTLSAKTSSSSQVNLWTSSGNNWSRYLRTTTTAAPSAGDDMIITGEWTAAATVTARTVTMDSTAATAYGSNTTTQVTPAVSICKNGTLSFGTTSSTNYILNIKGYMIVYNGGTLNVGTSGTPVPVSSTVLFEFQCTNAGDFGLVARNGSTVNMYGSPRTTGKLVTWCHLNADAAAAATSITIDTDTGWLSGDVVCLAPTTRTSSQFESKALTGNATSTTAAITALTNAHSGTSPTQAEVGLITRNVVFTSQATTKQSFFYNGLAAVTNCQWVEFSFLGSNTTPEKFGFTVFSTTGSVSALYCSFHDSGRESVFLSGSTVNNVTVQYSVFYNNSTASFKILNPTSGTWTFDTNFVCGAANSQDCVNLLDVGGTFTNNAVAGVNISTAAIIFSEAYPATLGTCSGNAVHSNSGTGFYFGNTQSGTINTLQCWRNNDSGARLGQALYQGASPIIFTNSNFFGNNNCNFQTGSNGPVNLVFDTCTFNGDTTFATNRNMQLANQFVDGPIRLFNCLFSQVSGIKTQATYEFWFNDTNESLIRIEADSCKFNPSTAVWQGISLLGQGPFLKVQNYNQVSNDNRAYYPYGNSTTAAVIQSNSSTVYGTNTLSEEMQPKTTNFKLVSQSIFVECTSGKAATPIVQVRKDGTYNGNAPRLIVKQQNSMGVTADTVLATFSASANTWQALTGTTVAASQDGVFEFIVDCDGTAGSVFVGDATATIA